MMAFRIHDWRAWAPGLETTAAWQAWAQAPLVVTDTGEKPACAFLPMMQRRRLSRLARMTMDVAWPLCGDDEQLPFVFASRHGETPSTFALLGDLANERPLSPTRFGLSVHNAIAGQWSILRGQHGESVALAGEGDTFEHAMLEAAALLVDGAPEVLLVIAEEMPPPAYGGWISDVPFSYALALRLGQAEATAATPDSSDWQLRLGRGGEHAEPGRWPHALDFLHVLLSGGTSIEHVWRERRWNWTRER